MHHFGLSACTSSYINGQCPHHLAFYLFSFIFSLRISTWNNNVSNVLTPRPSAGGGVTMAGAEDEVAELAALLSAPIAVTYLHNDAVPADNPLYAGPLGLFFQLY